MFQSRPVLLRVSQVAEQTGFHKQSIYDAIWANKIHAVRVGRGLRIPATELDKIAANGIAGPLRAPRKKA